MAIDVLNGGTTIGLIIHSGDLIGGGGDAVAFGSDGVSGTGDAVAFGSDGISATLSSDVGGIGADNSGAVNCACDFLSIDFQNQLKLPPDGHTMVGWVRVTFQAGGQVITVGNNSAPGLNNHACIKDFEFGHTDGCTCRVSIHDEQGSSFVQFMENILKDMDRANAVKGTTMKVEYGWLTVNCDNKSTVKIWPSPSFYFMMRDIECNFSQGKFMFSITGVDITEISFEGTMNKVYGGDGNTMYLTDAITQLFTEVTDPLRPPTVKSVKFLKRASRGGLPTEVRFKKFDVFPTKGMKGKWTCNGNNKIAVVKNWLKDHVTENNKTLIPTYNSEEPGGEIIFWEDTKPRCNEIVTWDSFSFGKYIVNGGSKSSVLEFNPKIKWNFTIMTNSGGGVGSIRPLANNNGGQNPGLRDCPTLRGPVRPGVGNLTHPQASDNAVEQFGSEVDMAVGEAVAIQQQAFQNFYHPIEAELVVLGDEKIIKPSLCLFGNVHIVFIDPYFIFEQDNNTCGEWLSKPICNPILSNKAWMVKNITQRISDGKFTTTLGVYLAAPGIDLDVNSPIGGFGSCGWQPTAN